MARVCIEEPSPKEVWIKITPESVEEKEMLSRLWRSFNKYWNPSDAVMITSNVLLRFDGESYYIIIII